MSGPPAETIQDRTQTKETHPGENRIQLIQTSPTDSPEKRRETVRRILIEATVHESPEMITELNKSSVWSPRTI